MTQNPTPPSPEPGAPPVTPAADAPASSEERTWGMLCHLTSLSALIGIPFGHILGPLIIWLIKKDQMPLVDDQGKESLNFQILLTIVFAVLGLPSIFPPVMCVTVPVMIVMVVVAIVFVILATIEANKGVRYRYPLNWRIIK